VYDHHEHVFRLQRKISCKTRTTAAIPAKLVLLDYVRRRKAPTAAPLRRQALKRRMT
jgi:hypothetical protein